ncbi:MAG: class I SAM-dependent methyltransferase [Thiohalospira sp.]
MNEVKINFSEKYVSKNPISRGLINNFSKSLSKLISSIKFYNILDVGCGEGVMLASMQRYLIDKECYAIDIDYRNIRDAKINFPGGKYSQGSIYELKFDNDSFDLVTCLEVLEHLEDPVKGLSEIQRVARQHVILSVPREPIWRILNMTRLKYWSKLGNTPGHLNNWSKNQFISIIEDHFHIIKILNPLPWTMVLCEVKKIDS